MAVSLTQRELAEIVGLTDRQLRNINAAEKERGRELLIKAEGGGYDATIFIGRWIDRKLAEKIEDIQGMIDGKARQMKEHIERTLTFDISEDAAEE